MCFESLGSHYLGLYTRFVLLLVELNYFAKLIVECTSLIYFLVIISEEINFQLAHATDLEMSVQDNSNSERKVLFKVPVENAVNKTVSRP